MAAAVPQEKRLQCIRLRLERQLSTPAIARMVGISNFSVYRILRDYPWVEDRSRDGRRVTRGKRWTEADLAFLKTFYASAPRDKIIAGLPGRQWDTIVKMASDSGLRRKPLAVNPQKRPVHPLCARLRQAREFQGMTRVELSAKTGFHVNDILCWETGKRHPRFEWILGWIDGLGLEIELRVKSNVSAAP